MTTDSAGITLVPVNASMHFTETLSTVSIKNLSMNVRLESGSDVQLVTNRTLKDAEWMVYITEADDYNDNATSQGAIGFLRYLAPSNDLEDRNPESCYISFALKRDAFSTLVSALQRDLLPEQIYIQVKGLSYGYGRTTVWDTVSNDALPIIEVGFNIPLVAPLKSM